MTALVLDVRELCWNEIDSVSGGDGFFEKVGEALDNPWATLGRAIDRIVSESRNSTADDFGTSGAYVTAKIG